MLSLDIIFKDLGKVLTPTQKRRLMDRLGCKTVQEVKELQGDDFCHAYEILVLERAKHLSASHISFSLEDSSLYQFKKESPIRAGASFLEKATVDN